MRQTIVCFDLDDTLYKEREFQVSGFLKIAEVIEKLTGQRDVFGHMNELSRERKNVFKALEAENDGVIGFDEMLKIYREHFPMIHLLNGASDLLDYLTEKGCVLGLITDGRSVTQRNKIKALGLYRWFSDCNIIISEEFGSEKPDKRNYLYFEERYPGCAYCYVGDNIDKDFIAPNHLGWNTYCLLDDGGNIHKQDMSLSRDYQPQVFIRSFQEMVLWLC